MGNCQGLSILFDGDSGNNFYAGQLVTGHVQLETPERIKIRGIRLHLTGKAKTSWSEGSGDSETYYSGKEKCMDFQICVIGSRSSNSEIFIEPSVNKYPFSFMLPADLPQSFEDKIGNIRYKAKALVDQPSGLVGKTEVRFTVIHLLDLNREPAHLREPLVLQRQAEASGCCCVFGDTEINATINRGCFVPGETMRFDGEIVNRTNSNIEYSTITLFQTMEYCATSRKGKVYHTKRLTKTLAKLKRPFLQSGHTDSFNNISFVIPQVLSSRLDGCGIINIRHYVEISAIFVECCSKSSVSSSIVIGNVPLQNDFQPSVVTSQPMEYPPPYNMAFDYMPPTNVTPKGFNTTGFQNYNYVGEDMPEVHKT